MYQNRHNYILGFHGYDKAIADKIVNHKDEMKRSENTYDWLGSGVYFWENNEKRALEWAKEQKEHNKLEKPAVIGAIICLGNCCDFLDSEYLDQLTVAYEHLIETTQSNFPKNKKGFIRELDCAVIETLHDMRKEASLPPFDTVRSLFIEGEPCYPGAGFQNKNHIQICVLNPNCIKGYFIPRINDNNYDRV